jgi:hypothetical protein
MPGRDLMTSEQGRELLIDSRGRLEGLLAKTDHLGQDGETITANSYHRYGDHIEALEESAPSSESLG